MDSICKEVMTDTNEDKEDREEDWLLFTETQDDTFLDLALRTNIDTIISITYDEDEDERNKELAPYALEQQSCSDVVLMEDAIKRVVSNDERLALQRAGERRRRERTKCLHLVIAITLMLILAGLVVGIRVRWPLKQVDLVFDYNAKYTYYKMNVFHALEISSFNGRSGSIQPQKTTKPNLSTLSQIIKDQTNF